MDHHLFQPEYDSVGEPLFDQHVLDALQIAAELDHRHVSSQFVRLSALRASVEAPTRAFSKPKPPQHWHGPEEYALISPHFVKQ